MNSKQRYAIEIMQHWIDYEKANKEKINKADELVEIQETVLNLIQTQQEEIEKDKDFISYLQLKDIERLEQNIKKDRIIDLMAKEINGKTLRKEEWCKKPCTENKTCLECLKEYFINKVEKENK